MEKNRKPTTLGSLIVHLLIFVFGIAAIYNAGNATGKWLFCMIN